MCSSKMNTNIDYVSSIFTNTYFVQKEMELVMFVLAETALNDCSKTVRSLNNVTHREIT